MEKLVRKIGLVAHDRMKQYLLEWVVWNSEHLIGHKFYCTGTTGTLIHEALTEKYPEEEWDITILDFYNLSLFLISLSSVIFPHRFR